MDKYVVTCNIIRALLESLAGLDRRGVIELCLIESRASPSCASDYNAIIGGCCECALNCGHITDVMSGF